MKPTILFVLLLQCASGEICFEPLVNASPSTTNHARYCIPATTSSVRVQYSTIFTLDRQDDRVRKSKSNSPTVRSKIWRLIFNEHKTQTIKIAEHDHGQGQQRNSNTGWARFSCAVLRPCWRSVVAKHITFFFFPPRFRPPLYFVTSVVATLL